MAKTQQKVEEGKKRTELARWEASNERNPIRMNQLMPEVQKFLITKHGLPAKVNPAFVVGLGGKPYIEHAGLWDLVHKDYVVINAGHVEPPMSRPCSEMGCIRRIHNGWRSEDGTIYETYPYEEKQRDSRLRVYKNYDEFEAKAHERMAIVHYNIKLKDRKTDEISEYNAYGDACPHNCTSVTRDALMRMAETRAINRCLRPIVGYAGTTYEEILYALPESEIPNGTNGQQDQGLPGAPSPKQRTSAPASKANGKRLKDFPGFLEQIDQKIKEECLIVEEGGEEVTRKIETGAFLEWLFTQDLLVPDDKGKLYLEDLLFTNASLLMKEWDKRIQEYWEWVAKKNKTEGGK